jgi:hypothetical protein
MKHSLVYFSTKCGVDALLPYIEYISPLNKLRIRSIFSFVSYMNEEKSIQVLESEPLITNPTCMYVCKMQQQ